MEIVQNPHCMSEPAYCIITYAQKALYEIPKPVVSKNIRWSTYKWYKRKRCCWPTVVIFLSGLTRVMSSSFRNWITAFSRLFSTTSVASGFDRLTPSSRLTALFHPGVSRSRNRILHFRFSSADKPDQMHFATLTASREPCWASRLALNAFCIWLRRSFSSLISLSFCHTALAYRCLHNWWASLVLLSITSSSSFFAFLAFLLRIASLFKYCVRFAPFNPCRQRFWLYAARFSSSALLVPCTLSFGLLFLTRLRVVLRLLCALSTLNKVCNFFTHDGPLRTLQLLRTLCGLDLLRVVLRKLAFDALLYLLLLCCLEDRHRRKSAKPLYGTDLFARLLRTHLRTKVHLTGSSPHVSQNLLCFILQSSVDKLALSNDIWHAVKALIFTLPYPFVPLRTRFEILTLNRLSSSLPRRSNFTRMN